MWVAHWYWHFNTPGWYYYPGCWNANQFNVPAYAGNGFYNARTYSAGEGAIWDGIW